jgi:hypothetical protein
MTGDRHDDTHKDFRNAPVKSSLAVWPAATCLITELAAELLTQPPSSWRHAVIILPTRRLQNWLLALLSDKIPAFVPPRFYNLDEYIFAEAKHTRLAARVCRGALDPLSDELLIASLLRAGKYKHLRPGCEHEVRQLFNEFSDAAINVPDAQGMATNHEAYQKLRDLVAADYVHCDESLQTLTERVSELEHLHAAYTDACTEAGVISAASLRAVASAAVADFLPRRADSWSRTSPSPRLYIVGFTSIAACHARLLRGLLHHHPQVHVWISETPTTGASSPLLLLRAMLSEYPTVMRSARAPLFSLNSHVNDVTTWQHPARLHRAASPLSEAATALQLVQKALRQGIPPSQIAILITNDKAYGPLLRCLLQASPLPYNMAVAMPLSQSNLGSWLTSLFDVLGGRDDTVSILNFMTQQQTLYWLQKKVGDILGCDALTDLDSLKSMITHAVCGSGVDHSLEFLATSQTLSKTVRLLCRATQEALAPLRQKKFATLSQWRSLLHDVFKLFSVAKEGGGPTPASASDFVEQSAVTAAQAFFESLSTVATQHEAAHAHRFGKARMPLSEFVLLIRDKLLAQEVRDVGDQLHGVQILSVEEARYVPFRYVLILGATEGQFPQALPKDRLLDNSLKSRLGLPGWQLREGIEDTTFWLLQKRLPALEIFYPAKAAGTATTRSRFIERLLLSDAVVEVVHEDDAPALAWLSWSKTDTFSFLGENAKSDLGANPTKTDTPTTPNALNMQRRALPQGIASAALRAAIKAPLAASALEKLIACPYRFLLDRLGVADVNVPSADDVRQEGNWLHEVLEAFFTGEITVGHGKKQRVTAPPPLAVADADFHDFVLTRLLDLTELLAPAHVKDSPVYLQLRHKSWPAFAVHLQKLYPGDEWRRGAAAHGLREKALAGATPLQLHLDGLSEPLLLRGYLDSVDRVQSHNIVTDYKRRGTPAASAARRGVAPQLWLYAYALSALDGQESDNRLAETILGYWSILKGEWVSLGAGSKSLAFAQSRGLTPGHAAPLEDLAPQVQELWEWRLTQLRDQHRDLRPDASTCGFCQYRGICRRDDPQLGPKIARETQESGLHAFIGAGISEEVKDAAAFASEEEF